MLGSDSDNAQPVQPARARSAPKRFTVALIANTCLPIQSVHDFVFGDYITPLAWVGRVVLGLAVLEWVVHGAANEVERDLQFVRHCSVHDLSTARYYVDYKVVGQTWLPAPIQLLLGSPLPPCVCALRPERISGRLEICAVVAAAVWGLGCVWVHSMRIPRLNRLRRLRNAVCGVPRASDINNLGENVVTVGHAVAQHEFMAPSRIVQNIIATRNLTQKRSANETAIDMLDAQFETPEAARLKETRAQLASKTFLLNSRPRFDLVMDLCARAQLVVWMQSGIACFFCI